MQTFVSHNPITYLVSTVRGLMVGGPVAENLIGTLVWMAGLVVVFVPLALCGLPAPRLNRRLDPADLVGLQRLGLRHVQ